MRLQFIRLTLVWLSMTPAVFGQESPLATASQYRITSFVGSSSGFGSRDGNGRQARFYAPSGVWGDDKTLYVADSGNHTIRKIVFETGLVTTLAGSPGVAGAIDATGIAARFGFVEGLWGDGTYLYVADVGNRTIRRVEIATGNVTTIAGLAGTQNLVDGVGSAARFIAPGPIWGDGTDLYIGDVSNVARVIRRLTISSGQVTTIANLSTVPNGTTFLGLWGEGTNLYVADAAAHAIRRVALSTGQVTTLAGELLLPGDTDGSSTNARFNTPSGIWGDGTNLFVSDANNATIRQVSLANGDTTTIAGLAGESGTIDGIGPVARFEFPTQLWGVGTTLFVADYFGNTIRRIDATSTAVSTIAGSASLQGTDDGTGSAARFLGPTMLWGDGTGLYIVDNGADTIRKANLLTAEVTSIAGSPNGNGSVDGVGSEARFWSPFGVAGDAGNLYISDASGDTIRRVQLSTAQVTTLAGNAQVDSGYADGIGSAARFRTPLGIWGNGTYLWVADRGNFVIRRIDIATGQVATFAGIAGQQGDLDGQGQAARFVYPQTLWGDGTNLYLADGHAIRRISIATAQVTTIAGTILTAGFADGIGTSAAFSLPMGMWGDGANLYVADSGNSTIRKVDLTTNSVTTIIGTARTPGTENGVGPAGRLGNPIGLWGDGTFLYVTDSDGFNVRRIAAAVTVPFLTTTNGGFSIATTGSGSGLTVGYGRIQPAGGSATPSGLAIFGFTQGDVLVTEAAVPAGPLIQSARIYAEVAGPVNTGVAIANPNPQPATINFYFTNAAGTDINSGTMTIPANGQQSAFLSESPFYTPGTFQGNLADVRTVTIQSSVPVSIVALRGFTNERSEFLLTTLPVTPLNTTVGAPLIFPHFADGGGWQTEVILVNPGNTPLNGAVQFYSQGSATAAGQVLNLTINGTTATSFNYSIPSHGSFKLATSGAGIVVNVGSVRVVPSGGNPAPSGLGVFSFRNAGITVAQAGVPALAVGSAFRLYAENGSAQTGFAIANSSSNAITVAFELTTLEGAPTGLTGSATVPGNGQVAKFLNEVDGFINLPATFQGILRIQGTGLSVVGLRGRYNQRGDFLISTTSPTDEASPAASDEFVFAHLADGGGYSTQFILFNGRGGSSSGAIRFLDQSGQPLVLPFQ